MGFSQATIEAVSPPQLRGSHVYVTWSSTSPVGTWYQVYVNQRVAWSGQRCRTWIPVPAGPVRIDIGAVGPGEQDTDFSASLPSSPARRVQIAWQSGDSGTDLAGFRIYGADAPGGPVDTSVVLADITAYPAGIDTGGFGVGAFGSGGFGRVAGQYSWTSAPLASGAWAFAVVPYNAAGNEGVPQTTTITVAAPPREPAPFAGTSSRLQYTLDGFGQVLFGCGGFGLPAVNLSWNPSPA